MRNHIQIIISIWFIAWSAFVVCSCVNSIGEEEEENSILPGDVPIKITAKALHTQIYQKDCDDAIGLYVLVSPTTLDKERYVENKRFKCTSSGFTPDEEVYYPAEKSKCDFFSYYPYQETGIAKGEQNINVSIRADQSSVVNYNNSDFMTAQVNNISSGKKSVALPHVHRLCQLAVKIKITEGYDISALKKDNPSIRINEVFTQATYDFEKNEFSSLHKPQNIIPNGEWSIENNTLTGKKNILIPQTITAGTEIITLSVDSKRYECQLTENYELESGTACELTLRYDPVQGVSGITASINDWKEGNKSEITPTEKKEKTSIPLSDFDFEQSSVYSITSDGKVLAEVCKEYLSSTGIHAQAIVIYPVRDGRSDWRNGTVLQLINEEHKIHGGKVIWNNDENSLDYIPGSQAPILSFSITSDLSIVFSPPSDPLLLAIKKKVLTDGRGSEAIVYPIAKIGTQYWTRENLKTTLYNDGKKITAKTSANYSKSSAGYFKESTYIFYNKAAVVSGKLAPKGWKIADNEDWRQLKAYTQENGTILKSYNLWKQSEYPSSNLTGFDAIPTGIFTKKKNANSSIYSFAREYAIFWNMGNNQKTLAENSILLRYNNDKIVEATHSDYCGYSVRCVME